MVFRFYLGYVLIINFLFAILFSGERMIFFWDSSIRLSISSFFVALLPERKVRAMLQKTVGIVLHVLKYNDTSNIVEMYTELSGRASFLVTVPRSKKATVKSVLFQPLALIEFEADYRPNTSLFRIKEAKSFSPCLLYTSPSPRD